MEVSLFLVAFALFLSPVIGGLDPDVQCINGIQTALNQLTFEDIDPEDYYGSRCTLGLFLTSFWASAKVFCTEKQIDAGSKLWGGYCTEYGMVELVPYSEVLPLLTDEYLAALPVVSYEDIDPTQVWNTSVMLSESLYHTGARTTTAFEMQYVLHKRYGWAVYGFWGGLLVIGMVNRLISHFVHSRRRQLATDVEGEGANPKSGARSSRLLSPFKSAHHWLRANLIIPAAFGSHHQRLYYWCTIPTRMETVIITLFWILNLILCCVSYEIFEPNLYYSKAIQHWRYIADRTGIISYANLPPLWMFSGRNNIFLWLTGWSFSSFNIFHRHIARVATIQAIVHSIGWSAIEIDYGYFTYSWKQKYWYMGGMATITMSLLLGLSSVWLRMRHYEIFLIIHIVLSVLTIVGLFYHTAIFTTREYDGYLWPCVAIWLVDRLARFVRLAYCNLHVQTSDAPKSSRATATYDKEADLIRIDAFPGSRILQPRPGQHYYIYQFNKLRFWENHPFTLAAWYPLGENDDDLDSNPQATPNPRSQAAVLGKEKDTYMAASSSSEGASSPSSSSISSQEAQPKDLLIPTGHSKLVFLIRPFNSWTKRLRDECERAGPSGMKNARILVEGPYGETSPLSSFENVIFVVGGTGIAGAIPHLQEYLGHSSKSPSPTTLRRETRTRDITIIWATKQSAMIRNIAAHELRPFLNREDIKFRFYATREKKRGPLALTDKLCDKLVQSHDIEISNQRPDIRAAVLGVVDEVNAAGSRGGRIAVLTCGPGAMADEARAAVHHALKNGKQGLEYFEESFGW